MARAIDSEAAYRFLSGQLVKETGAFSKGVNKGLNIARSAMRNPDAIPTLTPPNEPRMINADKLAKRIAGHSNYHGDSILAAIYCAAEGKENDAPIRPIETPQNEWVSVDERMPKIEKDYGGYGSVSVNVFNGKTVLPMDWESSVVRGKKVFRWKYPWGRIYDGTPITHWMPLPERPKEDE